MRKLGTFLWGAILIFSGPICADSRYVGNISDFEIHIEAHIERVGFLGKALYEEYPERYAELDADLLEQFLRVHDQAKREQNIMEGLFEFYAIPKEQMTEWQEQQMQRQIDELNGEDDLVVYQFFETHNLIRSDGRPEHRAELYQEIATISDLVDRGLDPVAAEEFARRMKPASEFLEGKQRSLAVFLEQNYWQITDSKHPLLEKGGCLEVLPRLQKAS